MCYFVHNIYFFPLFLWVFLYYGVHTSFYSNLQVWAVVLKFGFSECWNGFSAPPLVFTKLLPCVVWGSPSIQFTALQSVCRCINDQNVSIEFFPIDTDMMNFDLIFVYLLYHVYRLVTYTNMGLLGRCNEVYKYMFTLGLGYVYKCSIEKQKLNL